MPERSAALISAVPVPFTADGDLDDAGLQPLYRFLDTAGVDGVFTAGTTGEFTALDDDERETVLTEALAVFGPERCITMSGQPRPARPSGSPPARSLWAPATSPRSPRTTCPPVRDP